MYNDPTTNVNLKSGIGSVTDECGKQTTAYVVDKRYKVQDISWSIIWGYDMANIINNINNENDKMNMSLGDKLIFDSETYKLSADDLRVLLAVIKRSELGNIFGYKQQVLTELLGISKARVSKSIKKLVEYGVLYPLKEYGRTGFYINAAVSYKGELRTGSKLRKLKLEEQVKISLSQIKNGLYTGLICSK